VAPKKFFTWEEVDALDWGRYNEQVRFLARSSANNEDIYRRS